MPGIDLGFRSIVMRRGSPTPDEPYAVRMHRAPAGGSPARQLSFRPIR